LREIVSRILYVDKIYDTDDMTDWRCQWLSFAQSMPGVGEFPKENDNDNIDNWIDDVIAGFSRKMKIYKHLMDFWPFEVVS
jgi:hypothetical protein